MVLTAHQPVYLPWLGLFHKIASASTFVSFDGVQYQPKDWNNRNRILGTHGPQWLTVPVLRKGHRERPICEIEINNSVAWKRKHWRAISQTYGKAPYFADYADFLEDVYARDWQYLTELNDYMLKGFLDMLGIKVTFKNASEMHLQGRKSALVLDMCVQLKASKYIFGALGRDYADVEAFRAAGVVPAFQDYQHPVYQQLQPGFTSHLAVLDLLFNCGPQSKEILLAGQDKDLEHERRDE